MDDILQEIYNEEVDKQSGISPTLFEANKDAFHKAIDNGFINSANEEIDTDEEFVKALKHSADVFSLHRTATQSKLLAERMIDADGNLKSFAQFVKDTRPINEHYNKAWLRTEYDTAILRAQMAADWKVYERDADIFPNLRWMQTTSITPRETHAEFWMANLTLPIDDPFWDQHRPGDQWNCKCYLQQTNEPATTKKDMPDAANMPEPKAGLKGNPAKTKQIFSQDHPYFPNKCATCPLNTDGKVHGVKTVKDVTREVAKGNCNICDVAKTCQDRINSINDPKQNAELKAVKGYEDSIFIHKECDEKDLKQNLKTAKDLIDAGFKDIKHIVINHHIFEDKLPNQEFTIIFTDGRKVYADRKGATGEDAVKSSFRKAIKQCDKIVIIDSRHIAKIDTDDWARQLYGRIADFTNGIMIECIITRGGKVFRFDKDFMLSDTKDNVKNKIRKMLGPVSRIHAVPKPEEKPKQKQKED